MIVEATESMKREHIEEKMEHKIEDVFESARQAFFSPESGKASLLGKAETFTQVKSFDAPVSAPSTSKK